MAVALRLHLPVAIAIACIAVGIKVLMFPSYHSTDFEVHRNWLAITHSLPIEQWYFSESSQWSLDYPPFFAYFEYLLSFPASWFDSEIVKIDNLDLASNSVVFFQRGSVIFVDLMLAIATYRYLHSSGSVNNRETSDSTTKMVVAFTLVVFNAGLLLVDHMHFQYNGLLLGLLILCLDFANRQQFLLLMICFSILVLMKHLFVPLAPLFGVYLLATFCFPSGSHAVKTKSKPSFSFIRFLLLAIAAGLALSAAFIPFFLSANRNQYAVLSSSTLSLAGSANAPLYMQALAANGSDYKILGHVIPIKYVHSTSQLLRILAQLFPFGRGLVHAYWAPNIWALYCIADKILTFIAKKYFGYIHGGSASLPSSTSGIVGDFHFELLPSITPSACLLMIFLFQVPALVRLFRTPTPRRLLSTVVYGSLCSFMVGYHVHEKAIIIPILVQTLCAFENTPDAALFLMMAAPGFVGLFPLFNGWPELVVKWSLATGYLYCAMAAIEHYSPLSGFYKWWVTFSTIILVALCIFCEVLHPIYFFDAATGTVSFPFLPCLMTSVICAALLVVAWIQSFYVIMSSN